MTDLNERMESYRDLMIYPFGSEEIIEKLLNMGFFTAPASTKYHGAYEGGLFDHSCNVTKALLRLTRYNKLAWEREESPYIVGMFHDLCKCDQYYLEGFDNNVSVYAYDDETLLKGHGEKSIMLLSQFFTLTEEEILCIRYHMGAFVPKEEWNDYTRAIHKYPNVLWTHTADMLATHVMEIDV